MIMARADNIKDRGVKFGSSNSIQLLIDFNCNG
jgi:hypothetical protein